MLAAGSWIARRVQVLGGSVSPWRAIGTRGYVPQTPAHPQACSLLHGPASAWRGTLVRATPTVVLGDGRRGLAKKAKGAGGGGKGKGKNVDDDSPGEPIDTRTILKEMGDDCINATNNLDSELSLLRTGRADPRILDKVRVEAYTTSVSLEKIAQTVVTDARTLTVTIFDPELVGAVDKAIRGAGLDLNPQIAGSTLRVPIPKVTQEGRKKLTKQAGSIAENAKVVIRRIRHHYMDTGKKLDLPKDDAKKYEKDVQEIHDKAVKDIDARVKTKQAQLLDD